MSFGHDLEDVLSALVDEARLDIAAAQERVDALIDQTEPRERPKLVRALRRMGQEAGIPFSLPVYYRPKRQPTPLRREGWSVVSKRILQAADHLEERLKSRHKRTEDILGLTLASAIFNGCLLRPELWRPFCEAIAHGNPLRSAARFPDLVWLDLEVKRSSKRIAQSVEVESFRFFPDVTTLALIGLCKRAARIEVPNTPRALLQAALSAIGAGDLALSPEDIRLAGYAAIEDQSRVPIPSVLFEVARGSASSFSLPTADWGAVMSGALMPRERSLAIFEAVENDGAQALQDGGPSLGISESVSALIRAVNAIAPDAQKQTPAPVIAALRALLAQRPVPIIHGITLWLLSLLTRVQARKVNTVKRYAIGLGKFLARLFGADDPAQLSALQVEAMLESGLEALRRDRIYKLGRIAQLFHFASQHPQLRWPAISLDVEGEERPIVRTALLSPDLIKGTLVKLIDEPIYQIAFLLAVRGGLRLSDMEALQASDVEQGDDGMVVIHFTPLGSLKTSASRRMIPLARLLTPEELKLWRKYVDLRRGEVEAYQAPFLGKGGGLLPAKHFDRVAFSELVAQYTGLLPHGLRHAAISNLALLLLAPEAAAEVVEAFTGWRPKQQLSLREGFATDGTRGLRRLADMAGHREVAMTFERYVHVSDIALALCLQHGGISRPKADVGRTLGLNARRMKVKPAHLPLEAFRGQVIEKLAVTEIKALPPAKLVGEPVPLDQSAAVSLEMVLRIETLLGKGVATEVVAEQLAMRRKAIDALVTHRRLRPLRARLDQEQAVKIARTVLMMKADAAAAWALRIRAMPQRYMVFRSPMDAETILDPLGNLASYRLEVETKSLTRWGAWVKRARLIPSGKERLTVQPVSPAGIKGMALLKQAAEMVLRVGIARSALVKP